MGQLLYLRDVVTLKLDEEKCMGCGICLSVCPHAVLELTNGRVKVRNRDACMECGACSRNCPVKAVAVRQGVGCAAAVINSVLGRKSASCCTIDSEETPGDETTNDLGADHASCCQVEKSSPYVEKR